MGMGDQIGLDLFGQDVADTRIGGILRDLDLVEHALGVGDAQSVHQRAGITCDGARITRWRDHEGAQIAVLDAAPGAEGYDVKGSIRISGREDKEVIASERAAVVSAVFMAGSPVSCRHILCRWKIERHIAAMI